MGTKLKLTTVVVTVLAAAVTGSSAADPTLTAQSSIIGIYPTGVATSTGFGLVETVVLNADGSVTVTTRAAVATEDLTLAVVVATVVNSD